jgi:hypothetical protein
MVDIMFDCDFDVRPMIPTMQSRYPDAKEILIGRYISSYTKSWKVTSVDECEVIKAWNDDLAKVGGYCKMWLIFEDDGKPRTAATGAANAEVTREWISLLNWPKGGLICYTDDEDGPISPVVDATTAYFDGLKDASGDLIVTPGMYGSGAVLSALYARNLINVRWPTMSMGFTGSREMVASGNYEMRQLLDVTFCGHDVDPDVIRSGLDPSTLGFAVPGTGVDV